MSSDNISYSLFRRFLGKGGYPISEMTTDQYSDVNPPPPKSGNPWIDASTGLPYPGSPADKQS
jgi:hypothetical protein